MYSGRAISQLTAITSSSGAALNFRWPYQAKVMNTFEAMSRPMVISGIGRAGKAVSGAGGTSARS